MGTDQYTDVMVDIETTGLRPHTAGIIQLAAIPFNYDTMKIDIEFSFKESLTLPRSKLWSDGTDAFWMRDNREVYNQIMVSALPHDEVIRSFYAWVAARPPMRFWCKGLNFDWVFLENYFRENDLHMPFNFREAKDLRSFVSALYGRADTYEPEIDRTGASHDAFHDCLNQLKLLSAAKEATCRNHMS